MVILKYLVYVILVIAVIILLVGLLFPKVNFENIIRVDATIAKSWSVFIDEDRMGEWLTGIESIELISGEKNQVGSKYKLVFIENGKKMEAVETMTAFDVNEKFAFTMDNKFFTGDFVVYFSEENGQTVIKATNDFTGLNIIQKAMMFLMKSTMYKRTQDQYEKLKAAIESTN